MIAKPFRKILTRTIKPALDVSTSIDRVMPVRKLRCSAARRAPGGGGINVARVLKRLGAEVTALFPAGGSTGDLLGRLVAGEGVNSIKAPIAGETRENFTVNETENLEQFRFVLAGPILAMAEWQHCLDMLAEQGLSLIPISGPTDPY